MSQYGSDSDRPRGRRRRPDSDWSGYDAPPDGREFPDLQPIRPREARARDARQPGGGFAGGAVPGSFQGGGNVPGAFQDAPRAPQGYQDPQAYPGAQGYQDPQGYQGAQYGQYGQPEAPSRFGAPPAPAGRHSAPQPTLSPQPGMGAQPGMPMAPGAGSHAAPGQPMPQPPMSQPGARRRGGPAGWDDEDSDDPMAAFSERWQRRGQDGPADRRRRKRLYMITGGVAVIAIAAVVYFFTAGPGGTTNTGINSLVTSFLPGELKSVPNSCTAVPSGTVSQVLPGPAKQAAPPINSGQQSSQCTWTLDNPPTYRVLEANLTAEAPSGLASGDGSATFAAEDAFNAAEAAKKKPGAAGQAPATITDVPNLGDSAFSAFQQFKSGGSIMDMATVEVRYHNVIIQIVLNGIDHSSTGKQYGPVSQSTLTSQAESVAQQVTTKVKG